MSFSNPPSHMYPYLPPPTYLHPPIGTALSTAAPTIITKPLTSIPPPTENNIRYSAFERPITTVFIGNISDKIPDSLLKDALGKCGNVLSWKRVQGASGKLQAFGFCEYDNPEATLRCIRLLNEFSIAEKRLVVKVDPKTDDLLTEYKNKKQKAIEDREAEDVSKTEEAKKERINAFYAREKDEDSNALNLIKKLFKEAGSELLTKDIEKKVEPVKDLNIEEIDLDGDKKNIISREIESFRNKHKEDETSEEKDERLRRLREKDKERRREEDRSHRRHRSRSSTERDSKRRRADSRTSSIKSKKRSESKDTHKSHSKNKKESEKEVDEYDAAMYKKLEKKLREKEAAYQNRLQLWEGREKKKIKEYELDEERKINKDNEIAEEARKLQIFFEDYDDEKWDLKYYRGTELERRYNARRHEEFSDEKDRSKELEQIEQTRQRLIKDDDPNAESIILQMEQSMQEHLQKRLIADVVESPVIISESVKISNDSLDATFNNDDGKIGSEIKDKCLNEDHQTFNAPIENDVENLVSKEVKSDKDINENIKPDENLQSQIINDEQSIVVEENGETEGKNAQLISTLERNAMVKKIIDGIPTLKADLFAYPIEWKMVDDSFVDSRIKPWVDKKIATYIGEEEPSLSAFICKQVLKHRTPDEILSDIAMVLEEEADVFVMKMWRLLIYVIEERKCGLDK